MSLPRQVFSVMAALIVACVSVSAHHGNAAYDETKEVTLKGTVTEVQWANPHTQIYFEVKDENGRIVHWGCEALSPGKLLRAGWNRDSIRPGDQITITLAAAKNGSPVGLLREIVVDRTGKTLGIQEGPR